MSENGAVIVGASSGIGRAIAQVLAAKGWNIVISARRVELLEELAARIKDDHNVEPTVMPMDLLCSDQEMSKFLSDATESLGRLDALIVTVGTVEELDDGVATWKRSESLVQTNLVGPMRLAGQAVARMEQRDSGVVVLFSSIAAHAPRRRNVAYGAAKSGLDSFARSLRHRLSGSNVSIQLYTLGYVDTDMTAGQELKLPVTDPASVARRVVRGLDGGSRLVFEPRWWAFVTRVIRALPWTIYRRLRF